MSELIERVGADMLKALADLGEPDIDAGLGYLMGVEGVDVGSILARAAILAMKPATEEMVERAQNHLSGHSHGTLSYIFTAMIDVALGGNGAD